MPETGSIVNPYICYIYMTDFTKEIHSFIEAHHYDKFEPLAALIDMDGVLYDSMPMHARAWQKMASAHGIDSEFDEFFAYEGMTGLATINVLFQRAFGRDATPDEAKALYREKSDNFSAQGLPL